MRSVNPWKSLLKEVLGILLQVISKQIEPDHLNILQGKKIVGKKIEVLK